MIVHDYKPEIHQRIVKNWLSLRDLSVGWAEELPEIGFVVEGEAPIAIGFLRRMEGPFAIVDGYITNPTMGKYDRNHALTLLTNTIIEKAKELKIKRLLGFSSDNSILLRSLKHGFVVRDDTYFVLDF